MSRFEIASFRQNEHREVRLVVVAPDKRPAKLILEQWSRGTTGSAYMLKSISLEPRDVRSFDNALGDAIARLDALGAFSEKPKRRV